MLKHIGAGVLLACLSPIILTAQSDNKTTRTGYIKSASGQPLEHASITSKGNRTGATSNSNGYYSINAAAGDTLVISAIGYKSQLLAVNTQQQLNIQLQPSGEALQEVVVIGYGTSGKRNLLGSIASYDAKNIEEKPINRIEQALIGQLPGVQVRQQSGMAGSGLSILVRGSGSLSAGTEPLYVIDGFPLDVVSQNTDGSFTDNPLNNLSPNDIENIQILKDAAAGAIYGSRAANGVVLITTKRGQAGKMKISFNANAGISSVAKKLDILSPEEWVQMASEIADTNWVNSKAGRTVSQTQAERIAALGSLKLNYVKDDRWSHPGHPGLQYIDWQDVVYRKAGFQNYSLSASGGTENVRYFFAGNYMNQDGTLVNSNYKTYGLRANVEANASKKLKVGINLAPTISINNLPSAEGKDNILMKAALMSPVVEDSAGLYTGAFNNNTYTWSSSKYVSPLAYLENSESLTKITRIIASLYGEYQIIPGLAARTTVNFDGTDRTRSTYISDQVVAGALLERQTQPGLKSSGSYSGAKKQTFVNENTLSYNKTLAGKHNISLVAGQSYSSTHSEVFNISTAGGYANNIVKTLNNAIANSAGVTYNASTSASNSTLFSWYGRAQYNFNSRYLVSASFRRDASSRFGSNNRWGTFPSVSLGWRISDESFFKNHIHVVNDLKLRASWGRSGNNAIGDYNTTATLTDGNYNFGGNTPASSPGRVSAGIANPNLKWESSNTYDFGLDATLFKNRLTLTLDVYKKKSADLLMNLPVLGASGFNTALQNVGSMEAKGLELALNSINIQSRNFTWTTNANIAFNSNKVTSLGPNQDRIEIPSNYSGSNAPYLLQVGLPLFSYYVTRIDGLLTQDDINNGKVAKVSGERVGDPKFYDRNNDGSITADDRIIGGQPNPKYTWGLTNTFTYKKFDLSIQAYGQQGGSILSYLGRALDYSGSTSSNVLGIWRDRWTAQNQNYKAARGRLNASYTSPAVTSDWVYSSDFWRIQNITFGYNLKDVIKTRSISAARVFVALQNFLGKDKYKGGVNPEAQNTNNSSAGSAYAVPGDYGSMPLSKTVTLGVNFTF